MKTSTGIFYALSGYEHRLSMLFRVQDVVLAAADDAAVLEWAADYGLWNVSQDRRLFSSSTASILRAASSSVALTAA